MLTKNENITFYEYDWKAGPEELIPDFIKIINSTSDTDLQAQEVETDSDCYVIAVWPATIDASYTNEELVALWSDADYDADLDFDDEEDFEEED